MKLGLSLLCQRRFIILAIFAALLNLLAVSAPAARAANAPFLVKDLTPSGSTSFQEFIDLNGTLYFTADTDGDSRLELWASDGSSEGTRMLQPTGVKVEIDPRELITLNDKLFFSGDDKAHGRTLWTSDGTPNGTVLVKNIAPQGHADIST